MSVKARKVLDKANVYVLPLDAQVKELGGGGGEGAEKGGACLDEITPVMSLRVDHD